MITIPYGSIMESQIKDKILLHVDKAVSGVYYVPENIEIIQHGAFDGCNQLTSIVMNDNVKEIGEYAFSGCSSLMSVYLSSNLKELNAGQFANCTSLKHIIIPEGVKSIERYCFAGCSSLVSILLPHSLRYLGEYALKGTSIRGIYLPHSLEFVYPETFEDCSELIDIIVDKDNPTYYDNTGVLFSRLEPNGCRLLKYPPAKNAAFYDIPYGTVELWENAFSKVKELKMLSFPETFQVFNGLEIQGTELQEIHFSHTNEPELLFARAIPDVPHSCKFCVPQGTIDDYMEGEYVEDWMQFKEITYPDLP